MRKLLLLHGALGSKEQFDPLVEQLNDSYQLYTVNFEGHGGRPTNHDFSIDLFSQNVIQFLHEHAIDQIDIFGYSMGGYVALQTAIKAPNMINQIITLGTKFDWNPAAAEREVKMLNVDKIEEKVPRFADKLRKAHEPVDWKAVVQKTADMMLEMGNGAKLKDEDFKSISQHVVLGIGSLDSMVTYEESEHISKLLPNAHVVQLEGVEHPIEKVDPNIMASYIRSNHEVTNKR